MRDISILLLILISSRFELEAYATVNVKKLQDPNCQQSNGLSVLHDTTLILQCPNTPIEWIHRNITSGSKIKYHMQKNSNTTLRIENITHENDGCYCCRSAQDFSVSCVTVDVFGPPFQAFEPVQAIDLHCDKPVDIVCPYSGNPKPNITWQHFLNIWDFEAPGGPKFPDVLKDQINKPVLHVDKYYPEVEGTYICTAKNDYGMIGDQECPVCFTRLLIPVDCDGYDQYQSASLTKTYFADIGENVTMNCSLRFTCERTLDCLKVISWWDTLFPINRTTTDYGYRCSSCTVWKTRTIHNLQSSDFNKVFTCEITPYGSFNTSLIYNTTIQERPKNIQTEILLPSLLPTAAILAFLIISAIAVISIIIAYKKKITMFLYYRLAKEPPYTKELEKDVFISFASKDIDFVKEKIHDPIQRAGYKVIWYPDDFEIGGIILQEALKSIWKSRKTILCLSQNFLMSEHCKSEKDMCFEKAMKTFKNFLVIIHLDDCEIPTDLKKLKIIEMKQAANNSEDERKNSHAFSKLKYLLKAPIDRMT